MHGENAEALINLSNTVTIEMLEFIKMVRSKEITTKTTNLLN